MLISGSSLVLLHTLLSVVTHNFYIPPNPFKCSSWSQDILLGVCTCLLLCSPAGRFGLFHFRQFYLLLLYFSLLYSDYWLLYSVSLSFWQQNTALMVYTTLAQHLSHFCKKLTTENVQGIYCTTQSSSRRTASPILPLLFVSQIPFFAQGCLTCVLHYLFYSGLPDWQTSNLSSTFIL